MMRFASLALALSLAACGGADKSPQSPEQAPLPAETEPAPPAADAPGQPFQPSAEDTQKADAFVAALRDVGATVEANAGDCGKLGNALVATIEKHQTILRWPDELREEQARWLEETYADQVVEPVLKLQAAAQECQGDPEFDQAIQKLEEM